MQTCTQPKSIDVRKKLREAKSLERANKPLEALECYGQIIEIFPANAQARLGVERVEEMLASPPTEELIRLKNLTAGGCDDEALALSLAILENYPTSHAVWLTTGYVAAKLKKNELAEDALRTAYSLKPDDLDTCAALGQHLASQKQRAEALALFTFILRRKPDDAQILRDRGVTYLALEMYDKALDDLHEGVEYLTESEQDKELEISLRLGLGKAYDEQKKYGAAIEQYKIAEGLIFDSRLINMRLHLEAKVCDWSPWKKCSEMPVSNDSFVDEAVPFAFLNYEDDPQRGKLRTVSYAHDFNNIKRKPIDRPEARQRLRVGYVTGDLRSHATFMLLNGALEKHDLGCFEIFVYSITKSDTESEEVQRLLTNVDCIRHLHDKSNSDAVDIIRGDHLDIAVDLKGYTAGCRPEMFAAGLAPVQISYLGYPGTTGIDAMDYIIADERVIPPEYRHGYSEQVIYLPHSYQPNDDLRSIPDLPLERADYGLPDDAMVLCCFNNNWKITPLEYDVWMRILEKVDNAVLWLLADNDLAQENLIKEAKKRGICTERLIFAERVETDIHLARQRLADLFIDTFNCNAHTTATDALWAGLPVVTKAGKQFAARVAASLLTAVGLPDLVTETVEEYEALILRLASNPAELASIKARLAENRDTCPLYDTERYTRYLEEAYRQAVEAIGKPPADIYIPEDLTSQIRSRQVGA